VIQMKHNHKVYWCKEA